MATDADKEEAILRDVLSMQVTDTDSIDLSLLRDSLAKTPWERMQANDDAVNFGESLRAAMQKN